MPSHTPDFDNDSITWAPPLWDEFPINDETHQAAERQRRARARDLQEILSTESGRRFFKDMMILCGVFSEQFKGNSQTYFDQGCRAVGLRYWNLIGEADKNLQSEISPPFDEFPYAPRQENSR